MSQLQASTHLATSHQQHNVPTCACTHTHARTHARTHTHTHTHTCEHTHTRTHTRTHTYNKQIHTVSEITDNQCSQLNTTNTKRLEMIHKEN